LRHDRIRKDRGKCCICGHVSAYNDVHHVQYRDSWDGTRLSDLKVLCRRCHKAVHLAIEAMGADYGLMKVALKWRKTLEVVGKYNLIPDHYLTRKTKKRNQGSKKYNWKAKIADNQLRDSKLTVIFTKEMGKTFLKYTTKKQAALLGLTYPMAKGWKKELVGREFPRTVIKAVKEASSCDLETKEYMVTGHQVFKRKKTKKHKWKRNR